MADILIVEDDPAIAELIYMNLTAEGYRCTLAHDGLEGADHIEQGRFDLALLDIMLPEVDGYELLDAICGVELTPEAQRLAWENEEFYRYNPCAEQTGGRDAS